MKSIILIIIGLFIYGFTYSQTEYSERELNDMSKTYSFYLGQQTTINEIMEKHPTYKLQAKAAQDLWNLKFRTSIENIISELKNSLSDKFEEFENELLLNMSLIDYSDVTNEDIEYTIETIKQRANGDIPSPFLETLLSFNPTYQKSPEIEMVDGYINEFYTKESEKSGGVNVKIKYPKSWKAENGDRPHVVQKFTHFRGYEFGSALLMITKMDEILSKSDIDYLLSDEGLRNQIPNSSKILSTNNKIIIDNIPTGEITIYYEQQQMSNKLGMISDIYIMYYLDNQITLMCTIGSTVDNYNKTYNRYLVNKKLFRKIANNLVILSQYE
jgi:hypothetical protein